MSLLKEFNKNLLKEGDEEVDRSSFYVSTESITYHLGLNQISVDMDDTLDRFMWDLDRGDDGRKKAIAMKIEITAKHEATLKKIRKVYLTMVHAEIQETIADLNGIMDKF